MVIGVPKEIKTHEYRVALTPDGVLELIKEGHRVLIESAAGSGSGFSDEDYLKVGAIVVDKPSLFEQAELIVKVKEPLPEEYGLLRQRQILFTYLHLAPNPALTDALIKAEVSAFAYETLEVKGTLPLLAPMSEIAGRMSPLVASYFLQRPLGGSGVLPTGVAGVPPAKVLIIGAGTVGTNAARVALGLGMQVTVLNRGIEKLNEIEAMFRGAVITMPATEQNIRDCVRHSDIVIGAVLVAGQRAPRCISRDMLATMKKGSVIVDVSIDQGGCVETSRPTTHDSPVYETDGIIHYCVANMPGAYPKTSTLALTNRTLPYIKKLASMGAEEAVKKDDALKSSLNIYQGQIVHQGLLTSLKETAHKQ